MVGDQVCSTYLEVEEDAILSAPCLTLADDDGGHG